MTQRETAKPGATRRMSHGGVARGVTRGLALAALLLPAFSSADAQTGAPVAGGPSVAITDTPGGRAGAEKAAAANTDAASAGTAATDTATAEAPPAPAQAADAKPDGFTVGGFTFKPGGRVKLDIIRDFSAITSEDSFDPRTIPVDGSEGGNSQLHARETRLSIDIRGPVEGKELRMYVETDFYGSGNALRLRHAYGSWGGLLAGQTWSTFVDDANMPNTIDFESPMSFPSLRQAQLRWTQPLSDTASWSVAVEDNKSSITPPDVPGKPEYPMPDLVGRIRVDGPRLHTFVAGFLGQARFRPATGDVDNVTLWGGVLSARLKTVGQDALYGQFTFGDGVGRYRSAVTAVPDENGQLHAARVYAVTAGYEHYWSPRLSSNGVYGVSTAPEEDFYSDQANAQLGYGALNLLYWFLPGRAWVGVEYIYGRREVFSDASGTAHRLQYAVRFNLP
jgi:hypothetical protein